MFILLIGIPGPSPADPKHTDEALFYLGLAMPDTLYPYADFEIASRENIRATPEGHLALGITNRQRLVNNGMRAEVSIDYPFTVADRVSYRWQFRIPEDFQADPSRNRWIVAGQWHDQPDFPAGDTWETFVSHSPPIAFSLGEVDGEVGIVMRYGVTARGEAQQESDPLFFARGAWQTIDVTVRWSQGNDGTAALSFNDDLVATFVGPNMNNAMQHYLKLGLYRHPDIRGDQWIALRDIAIEHR